MSVFSKWFSKKKGKPVQECPKKGDICIYVYRLDTGEPVPSVKVSVAGTSSGQSPTDGNGFAEFLDRDPGPYQFGVALPGNLAHYKIEPYSPDVGVSAGNVATATVAVYPTGQLNVQVYDDLNRLVKDPVAIDAVGAESKSQRVQTGTHLFKDLICGAYDVTATAPSHLYDPYQGSATKVAVPDGGTGNARIVVKILNIVDPEITVDRKELWFLAPATEEQAKAEEAQGIKKDAPKKDDEPVHFRLSYKESRPEKPFKDGATVQFGGAQREAFVDKACKTPFALDQNGSARINNQRLSAGVDIYVRANSDGQLTATLTLDPPADTTIRVNAPVREVVQVKAESVVTPKLELEYKVVLADPDLSKHQDAKKSDGTTDEEKIIADDVTYIQVSASERGGAGRYTKGGKLEITAGADKVKVYTDMRRTKLLDRTLTHAELFRASPFILYLGAVKDKEGELKLKLTLDPSGDPHVHVQEMNEIEMAVVKLDMKLFQHKAAIVDEEFAADKDTLDAYFTALKDKVLPDQEEMSDEHQVKPGRLLHAQKDGNHGRAKLIVKKLTGHWPAGTDDYHVVLAQTCDSGAIALFDKETEGDKKDLPYKIKVKDLKAKDVELWVEGTTATKLWRDAVLDLGIDRDDGGLAKEPKHNGDWARFTVVQVKEVKLDYKPEVGKASAWNDGEKQFYINFKDDPDGRKIKIAVELTEKLEGVPLHFMLAPHKDNGKKANLGEDIPATWKWKDIEAVVKHKDRSAEKKLLHLAKKTDANGKADLELTLSRFGGQIFEPAAYITQDPHLAKYVLGHTDLEKRKPVRAVHTITVWRKFWYQEVKVKGVTVAGFGNAADTYRDVKVTMEAAPVVEMELSTARTITPKPIYPKHMLNYYRTPTNAYANNFPNDTSDGLVVGDANESSFFALATASDERPVMIPMMNVHGLWIADGHTSAASFPDWVEATAFPVSLTMDTKLIDPPLQGGTLFRSGTWQAQDWDPAANGGTGGWVNARNGSLAAGDVELDAGRSDPRAVNVKVPAGITLAARTRIKVSNLTLRAAATFLGTSYDDGIVNKYTPNDEVDFINTINHELGHSFKQVAKVRPAGVPAHPHQYDRNGSHCRYQNDSCLMFESGPQAVHLDRYCPICHPYVIVQTFRK